MKLKSVAVDPGSYDPRLDAPAADAINRAIQAYEMDHGRKPKFASFFRDPERNDAAGGAQNSEHLHGAALDVDMSDNDSFAPYLQAVGFSNPIKSYKNPKSGKVQSEANHWQFNSLHGSGGSQSAGQGGISFSPAPQYQAPMVDFESLPPLEPKAIVQGLDYSKQPALQGDYSRLQGNYGGRAPQVNEDPALTGIIQKSYEQGRQMPSYTPKEYESQIQDSLKTLQGLRVPTPVEPVKQPGILESIIQNVQSVYDSKAQPTGNIPGVLGQGFGVAAPAVIGGLLGTPFGPAGIAVGSGLGGAIGENFRGHNQDVREGRTTTPLQYLIRTGTGATAALPLFKGATLAGTIAKNAGVGAVVGGAGTALEDIGTGRGFDVGRTLEGAGVGTVLGAATGPFAGIEKNQQLAKKLLESELPTGYNSTAPSGKMPVKSPLPTKFGSGKLPVQTELPSVQTLSDPAAGIDAMEIFQGGSTRTNPVVINEQSFKPFEHGDPKPRVNNVTPKFESDIDRALYIIANRAENNRSVADDKFLNFARQVFPDLADKDILNVAGRVKQTVVNEAAAQGEKAVIPKTFQQAVDDLFPVQEPSTRLIKPEEAIPVAQSVEAPQPVTPRLGPDGYIDSATISSPVEQVFRNRSSAMRGSRALGLAKESVQPVQIGPGQWMIHQLDAPVKVPDVPAVQALSQSVDPGMAPAQAIIPEVPARIPTTGKPATITHALRGLDPRDSATVHDFDLSATQPGQKVEGLGTFKGFDDDGLPIISRKGGGKRPGESGVAHDADSIGTLLKQAGDLLEPQDVQMIQETLADVQTGQATKFVGRAKVGRSSEVAAGLNSPGTGGAYGTSSIDRVLSIEYKPATPAVGKRPGVPAQVRAKVIDSNGQPGIRIIKEAGNPDVGFIRAGAEQPLENHFPALLDPSKRELITDAQIQKAGAIRQAAQGTKHANNHIVKRLDDVIRANDDKAAMQAIRDLDRLPPEIQQELAKQRGCIK